MAEEPKLGTKEHDLLMHRLIKERARAIVEFLQIDEEVLMRKLPHLKLSEPYNLTTHVKSIEGEPIGQFLDHTLLKVDATADQFVKLCEEAVEHGIGYVCVPGGRVEGVMTTLKELQTKQASGELNTLNSSNDGLILTPPVERKGHVAEVGGVGGSREAKAGQGAAGSKNDVKVACVMAFPHGNGHSKAKVAEASLLLGLGATELDMVIDVGKLKEKNYHDVQRDIRLVCEEASKRNLVFLEEEEPVEEDESVPRAKGPPQVQRLVKVILETCLLENSQIIDACILCVLSGAHFVKTSTGFSTGGATLQVVRLMKLTVGSSALVKASGGIRNYQDALEMLHNGASRIGTSAAVSIAAAQHVQLSSLLSNSSASSSSAY